MKTAGERTERITIEACTETVGPSSFPVEAWAPLEPAMYAARDTPSGGETFVADQVSASVDVTWTMPYRADCDPDLLDVVKVRRVVAYGRVYDIVAATQTEHAALELRTRAKVG